MTYDAVETGTLLTLCGAFAIWEGVLAARTGGSPAASERLWNGIGFLACLVFVGAVRAVWCIALTDGRSWALPFDASNTRFSAWRVVAALLFVDVLVYWVHRAMHSSPLLWRTHRWHHMPTRLTWVAGFRASFTQTVLWTAPQYLLFVFFDFSWKELAAAVAIGLWFQLWEHTRSRWGHALVEWFVATPGSHVHHHARDVSNLVGATRSVAGVNYAPIFTVWDRIFGTFVPSNRARGLDDSLEPLLGIDGCEDASARDNLRALVGV